MAIFKLSLLAFALMLIFEGILPLTKPELWRQTMLRLLECKDGQLRTVGMFSVGAGLIAFIVILALF